MKKRILFVAENVTLAQVVRLKVLADSLDSERYEIHFASSEFHPMVFQQTKFERHSLTTIEKAAVERAFASGRRLYEKKTLERYVKAELRLIEEVEPNLIVGDFRLSLSVSAPLSGVPHATLINAYWSPFRSERTFPVPDHPIIRLLGEELTKQYFPRAIPRVFDHFAAPLNAVRKNHGLPPIGNLQQVLCHGNYTLYPDVPGLVPTQSAPPHHLYLGPVLWSPDIPFDESLLHDSRPLIYVTLGSSGKVEVLPIVLEALGQLPVHAVVATADRARLGPLPSNVTACSFVPGQELARRALAVISNGGSTTGYQALSEGTPVLGVASNFDQYLSMQAIERAGAGITVKARSISAHHVTQALRALLDDARYRMGAQRVASEFALYPARQRFSSFVDEVLTKQSDDKPLMSETFRRTPKHAVS